MHHRQLHRLGCCQFNGTAENILRSWGEIHGHEHVLERSRTVRLVSRDYQSRNTGPTNDAFRDQRSLAPPTACLTTHDDQVHPVCVGVELDDFCGVAVLFGCVQPHTDVCGALTEIRHPLQPSGRVERERLIRAHGVKHIQLCAGRLSECQRPVKSRIATVG
jgi:hypothetical protein